MRVLPLGNGGVAHLFEVYGYQGAESDPEKLALTDQMLPSVLGEAKMCCPCQPVILVVDLDADPMVIPSLTRGISDGAWIDVEEALATGRSDTPTRVNSKWMRVKALVGTLLQYVPKLQLRPQCPSRSLLPTTFCVSCKFSLAAWDAKVEMSGVVFSNMACLLDSMGCPLLALFFRSGAKHMGCTSPGPAGVRLRAVYISSDVDASWNLWSQEAEAGPIRAYQTAEGPALAGPCSFIGRGSLSLRTGRLESRCRSRRTRLDVANARCFITSSLSPHPGVPPWTDTCAYSVLKVMKNHGYSDAGGLPFGMGGWRPRKWDPLDP